MNMNPENIIIKFENFIQSHENEPSLEDAAWGFVDEFPEYQETEEGMDALYFALVNALPHLIEIWEKALGPATLNRNDYRS